MLHNNQYAVYFIIGGWYNIVIGSVIHTRRYVCFTLTGMLSNSIHFIVGGMVECDS